MGHGSVCAAKNCSHRLGQHKYDSKKRALVCTRCRCDKYV